MKLRLAMFYHSVVSDWNHGNAHFLRGIASEWLARGHELRLFEPENSWSRENLVRDCGQQALEKFDARFPHLHSHRYTLENLDLRRELDNVDLVLVHEWNDPRLISAIGEHRLCHHSLRILFHDTHHRAVTAPDELNRFDLTPYDGVLAYGTSLKRAYEHLGWGRQVHVWHEAADTRVFFPRKPDQENGGEIVWIGNWGDEERSEELREYLIRPVARKGWRTRIYGVRYPARALRELAEAGIGYGGWLANFEVPDIFARFKATAHVPRRPYVQQLPGIPTIRPFEALACGIPLISAPWDDCEGLFRIGQDFLMAQNGLEMEQHLGDILHDASLSESLSRSGLETIRTRHTCTHRVNELLNIFNGIRPVTQSQQVDLVTEVNS